ncbi:NAD-dependent epimerase/dehydratase family protein [Nonomuraea thailandensis]
MTMETVVLTGAAGSVGSVLREPLRRRLRRLVSVDRAPLTAAGPGEEVRRAELGGAGDVRPLVEGADAVVHLAGLPDEAPLPELLEANVLGTHHVLEAARLAGSGAWCWPAATG